MNTALPLAAATANSGSWWAPLLAEGQAELAPLFKVEAYMWLVLLLIIMLLLFVFNRLMATWARHVGNSGTKPRENYYADDSEWANNSDWSWRSMFHGSDDSSDPSGGDWDSSDPD